MLIQNPIAKRIPGQFVVPPAPPGACFTSFKFEVLDPVALAKLEPVPFPDRGVLRLCVPWTEGRTIRYEGADLLRLEPVDATADAIDVTRAIYDVILESEGTVPSATETSTRWHAEAEAWASTCRPLAPRDPFEKYSGTAVAFHAQIADRLCRSFLIDTADAPTRTLWPTGHDADRLAEAETTRDAARVAAEAEVARAQIEARTPRTLAALGLAGVAVALDRPGSKEPWADALASHITDTEIFYLYRAVEGLELVGERYGIRSVSPDEVFPPLTIGVEMNPAILNFLRVARFASSMTIARGEVTAFHTSPEVTARAEAIATESAGAFLAADPVRVVRANIAVQQIVRGLCMHPAKAAHLLAAAVAKESTRRQPAVRIPSGPIRRDLETGAVLVPELKNLETAADTPEMHLPGLAHRCVAAAVSGDIGIGALLTPHVHVHAKKATKKS